MDYNKAFGEMSINTLVDDLVKQCELVNHSDLRRAEALLITQAHTLDSIFHMLARRAKRAELLNQLDTNLRLALKAQSQCRATLDTLAAMKNPRVAFVQQANIAHGPQQVNNQTDTRAGGRARENESAPNGLLESKEHDADQWLDRGTPQASGRSHSRVEAVAEFDRTEDNSR